MKLKVSSKDLGAIERTAKVTVAEGVRLEVPANTHPASAAPGGTVSNPLGVRNGGDNPISGWVRSAARSR